MVTNQWGNITSGTELIRRIEKGKGYALTCPLITKSDGSKFGKTQKGNIWLDSNKTSVYKFYQYWLNTSDQDAEKYIKIFTFLSKEKIKEYDELKKKNFRKEGWSRRNKRMKSIQDTVRDHEINIFNREIGVLGVRRPSTRQ